jgi:sensor c-di-GMP phosphodiesterase-like protein
MARKKMQIIPVSVNISRLDLGKPRFVKKVFNLLDIYKIESSYIQLELTETAFVTEGEIISDIEVLRTNGIKIAIDDFGKGYSTLAILKTIPVDIMKIDLLFLEGIQEEPVAQDILNTIVDLAKCLNLSIVYEGVETRKQVDYLMSFGQGMAQGYYYAKPLAKIEMEHHMTKRISCSGGWGV